MKIIHDIFCSDITASKEGDRATTKWLTASRPRALCWEVMDWKTEGSTLYKLFSPAFQLYTETSSLSGSEGAITLPSASSKTSYQFSIIVHLDTLH
jgi:hypothetical protein